MYPPEQARGLRNDFGNQLVPAMGRALGSGISTASNVPTPLAGVPSACATVEASLSTLAQALTELAHRLESAGVLRAEPPAAVEKAAGYQPTYSSSLANSIQQHAERVVDITRCVQHLQERIDL